MILNNSPQNEAILSNVGEIGEFRIRNSAKAYNILSSGLYANKIKAIIRELSCNAVDSHIAAGQSDVKFEVHLPNALEPHFSIRDFGTGLSHEQVTNIYTTYFESTKTGSNDFIGALGLGSKSPFSYTDNFTVTAIKDGRKGIYSAFINAEGVPSIAIMMEEATDEPAGVEIKFSVNDRFDFSKFKEEAASVYRHFKQKPTVSGISNFTFDLLTYETENLIPGVHVVSSVNNYRNSRSLAVMGNIAYPIDIPNPDQLGPLRSMLDCGLEMHFEIGELDFQASREGLSYIPQTIDAIKAKLQKVSDALAGHIKVEADAIPNMWDRAVWLSKKREHNLWYTAVDQYVQTSNLETAQPGNRYRFLKEFRISVAELASKYNIVVRGFSRSRGSSSCNTIKESHEHGRDSNGTYYTTACWDFQVSDNLDFVVNDTKIGCGERAKYHYRETEMKHYTHRVFVLDKADAAKDMDLVEFFKAIKNPPEDRIFNASSLKEKPRKDSSVGRNVSILRMEKRRRGYHETIVWADAGKVSSFDTSKTHYYMPLSGYVAASTKVSDVKTLREWLIMCGIKELSDLTIYGVRKVDMEEIKKQPNWVNVETFIEKTLQVPDHNVIMNLVEDTVSMQRLHSVASHLKDGSPFKTVMSNFDGYTRVKFAEHAFRQLYSLYGSKLNFDLTTAVKKFVDDFSAINKRYPLLNHIDRGVGDSVVAEYIAMVDNFKGE